MGKVQEKLARKAEAKCGEGSSEETPETEEAEVATEEAVAEDGTESTE